MQGKERIMKSCFNCEYSGTYTVDEVPVCWLKTADLPDDRVYHIDENSVICEDYEERKES